MSGAAAAYICLYSLSRVWSGLGSAGVTHRNVIPSGSFHSSYSGCTAGNVVSICATTAAANCPHALTLVGSTWDDASPHGLELVCSHVSLYPIVRIGCTCWAWIAPIRLSSCAQFCCPAAGNVPTISTLTRIKSKCDGDRYP